MLIRLKKNVSHFGFCLPLKIDNSQANVSKRHRLSLVFSKTRSNKSRELPSSSQVGLWLHKTTFGAKQKKYSFFSSFVEAFTNYKKIKASPAQIAKAITNRIKIERQMHYSFSGKIRRKTQASTIVGCSLAKRLALKKISKNLLQQKMPSIEEGEVSKNYNQPIFSKGTNSYLIPDFVEIQRKSFFKLLEKGLIEEFSKRNPITNKNLEIFFYPEYYQLTPPEYNPRRAILISKSYSAKLFIPAQLTDKKLQKSQLKWVLIGNLPLMTKRGHFVLNGAPRVIVNQILRSPGIYFQGSLKEVFSDQWSEKAEITYKRFYADLICLRGTWLRIEIDKNKDIWAQMKKVPKIPLLWFLLGMGLTERIIFKSVINPTRLLANFNTETKRKVEYEYVTNPSDAWKQISHLISSSLGTTSLSTAAISSYAKEEVNSHSIIASKEEPSSSEDQSVGGFLQRSVTLELNKNRGLQMVKEPGATFENENVLEKKFSGLLASVKVKFCSFPNQNSGSLPALKQRRFETREKQVLPIQNSRSQGMSLLRKNESNHLVNGTTDSKLGLVSFLNVVEHSKEGRNWIFKRFMNPRAYDLGNQGRLNINRKLGLTLSSNQTTLTAQDLLFATDYLLKVEKGLKNVDDIDHLKNRRVRTSGELLQIQIGIGLVRLEKIIREKLSKINAQTRTSNFVIGKQNYPNASLIKTLVLRDKPVAKKSLDFGREKYASKLTSKQIVQKSTRKNLVPLKRALLKKNATFFVPKQPPIEKKRSNNQKTSLKKETILHKEEFKMTNLINTKAFNGALREFFGTSQLSQFMDQLNPLAEITHKRRLSSMGPGGVTRDSATLAIRGIHPTHYGRICPIETPEGKNTGLVNSLTTYARANPQGFLESPFYKVYKGQIQKNAGMFFFSAEQEENIKLAAADVATPSGRIAFLPKYKIPAKIAYGDTISKISRNIVEYIGVSPIQMISIATSLIPFLEHDDANRALMGSNMQRQAVPLVRAERPLVGTGLESRTVSDSGHAVVAKESGYVAYVSGRKMILYAFASQRSEGIPTYSLKAIN